MSNCPVCLGIPGYEIHMCGRVDEQRPSTPVGWSDTDWIKHLDEKRHPLDCNHINQGSADAAADAYEGEYKDAKIAKLTAENERLKERYNDLIMRVGKKTSGETRHETAARYLDAMEAIGSTSGEED